MSRWAFYSYILWLCSLAALTTVFWLKPVGFFTADKNAQLHKQDIEKYSLIASLLTIVFFVSCFLLGVWLSIIRSKGLL